MVKMNSLSALLKESFYIQKNRKQAAICRRRSKKMAEKETIETEVIEEEVVETAPVAKKNSDKPAEKKPGFFKRVAKWFHELKVEAKKVVWPNKKTVTKNTVVVIVALIVLCAVVTVLDVVFGGIRDLLAQLV
jgi:preprotein translocase subunit SecE